MLQQTQVKIVIPYFNRFMQRFPDIKTLAQASNDEVMSYWSGLGYYARARNLLKTARACLDNHGGSLPESPKALTALAGIGESTANAIYSQAYNQPAVILDGNVKRVLARYFAVDGWPGKSSIHKKLWRQAEQLLPQQRGADYTQAIMDLGATVCTRTRPDCDHCPVNLECEAFKTDKVENYPSSRPPIKISKKSFQMLIITNEEDKVLLERRPPAGIWGGLWSLPADDNGEPLQHRLALSLEEFQPLPDIHHQLTHMQMTIQPLIGRTEPKPTGVECGPEQRWFARHEWPDLGLPKPVRQLLELHLENAGQ